MMLPEFLAGGALYVLAATAYFHARFALAALLGAAFFALTGHVALAALGTVAGGLALLFLCVGPSAYLAIHYVDAKKGLFYLPTIYSIPIAFLAAALLWVTTGLAVALR